MLRGIRGYRLLLVISLLTFAADQSSKYLVVSRLTGALDGRSGLSRLVAFYRGPSPYDARQPARSLYEGYAFLPNYWSFRYVENPGAAWGLWANLPERFRQPFFLGVSVLALGFISFMYTRLSRSQRFLRAALALVMGGALGNFVDRLLRGYVIDFIDWHWRNQPALRWPTFNVADAAISVGVGLILAESLRAHAGVDASDEEASSGVGLGPGARGPNPSPAGPP